MPGDTIGCCGEASAAPVKMSRGPVCGMEVRHDGVQHTFRMVQRPSISAAGIAGQNISPIRPPPINRARRNRSTRWGDHAVMDWPVPCTRTSAGRTGAPALSAAWRWSQPFPHATKAPIEIADFTRRLIVAVILCVPLLLVAMVGEMLGLCQFRGFRHGCDSRCVRRSSSGAACPSSRAAGSRCTGHLNMFTLIATGVGAAFRL